MKRTDWQKVYAPQGDGLELRVKYTLAALDQEQKGRVSMRKGFALVLAAVLVLAVGGVGASSLFAAQYDPVRLANAALAEEYGITDEMQTYFNREVITEDNVTSIIYNGLPGMEHVLGQYTVRIENGEVTVGWSHDGQSTEGELSAMAWGAQQIEILLDMAKEEQGFARGYRKAQELRVSSEDAEITISVTADDGTTQATTIPLDETDASIRVDEEACISIAKEAFAQIYGLTEEQIEKLEYNRGYAGYTYAVKNGKPVCELYFWLHQQDGVYHTDGDGIYWAEIDAQTGEVLDVVYDSALAGNG